MLRRVLSLSSIAGFLTAAGYYWQKGDLEVALAFVGILVSIIPFLVQMRSTEGEKKQGTRFGKPRCFLVGLNRLFEREQSIRLSDDDADRLMLENTRKVYMAATRAGQRLILTYVGNIPEVLGDLITKQAE